MDAQLGHKGENRHAHQAGGRLHLLVVQDFQHVGAGEDAQEQRVENGEDDEGPLPDGNLDLSDGVRDEDEDEGQQIQEPLRPDPLPQGGICAFGFFHGAHSFIVDSTIIPDSGLSEKDIWAVLQKRNGPDGSGPVHFPKIIRGHPAAQPSRSKT